MQLQREKTKSIITLGDIIASGGEAKIYEVVGENTLVAKLYHQPTNAHERKLTVMIANPPDDPMAGKGHVSIAWPIDILRSTDGQRRFVGFLMPRISEQRPIIEFYNPQSRRQQCPLFNWRYLHRTARNFAAAVGAIHTKGYVIGDVNESNILVADTAYVGQQVRVRSDSRLVMSQLGMLCVVRSPRLQPWWRKVKSAAKDFEVEWEWVPRAWNREVDALTQLARSEG